MRIAVGLLACIGAGALTSALADPPTDTTTGTPAAAAAAAPVSSAPPASKEASSDKTVVVQADVDKDTRHFLAEGYKPEMRNGERIYCKKETVLGSRLNAQKHCGTLEQLKLSEEAAMTNVSDLQRRQVGTSNH